MVTANARSVLEDCSFVLEKLESSTDEREWRIYWVAVMALLATVGYVLDESGVPSQKARFKRVLSAKKNEWHDPDKPEHEIFREFVKHERNEIIHRYALGIAAGTPLLTIVAQGAEGEVPIDAFILEENIYRPMASGAYELEDGRTLVEEAIKWWGVQLDDIDRAMNPTS